MKEELVQDSCGIEWVLSREDKFKYQLLSRMQMDCEYALGNGQIYGNHLWAGNIEDQIMYMKAIWNSFPDSGGINGKPQWLSMEQIEEYHVLMKEVQARKKWEGKPVCILMPSKEA